MISNLSLKKNEHIALISLSIGGMCVYVLAWCVRIPICSISNYVVLAAELHFPHQHFSQIYHCHSEPQTANVHFFCLHSPKISCNWRGHSTGVGCHDHERQILIDLSRVYSPTAFTVYHRNVRSCKWPHFTWIVSKHVINKNNNECVTFNDDDDGMCVVWAVRRPLATLATNTIACIVYIAYANLSINIQSKTASHSEMYEYSYENIYV